jgi:hypothetical protein
MVIWINAVIGAKVLRPTNDCDAGRFLPPLRVASMATRPTAAKTAPVKKSAAKKPAVATPSAKPATPAPKAKAVAAPVVTLKAV